MAYQDQNPYNTKYPPRHYSNAQQNGYIDPRYVGRPHDTVSRNLGQVTYLGNEYINHNNGFQAVSNGAQHQHQQLQSAVQSYPPSRPQHWDSFQTSSHQYLQPQQYPVPNVSYHPPPLPQHQGAPHPNYQRPPEQRQQQAYAVAIPAAHVTPSGQISNGYEQTSAFEKPVPPSPPLDYASLLLSMADEYFAAAYSRGSIVDITKREKALREYYKLITTGLGCLEALLNFPKLAPETEVTVRLRYATVLYEETDNIMEAEEALSKGISICDRYKYFDVKYNMQHLLGRLLFQKNHRAAFKFLDGAMTDAQAYQHIAWVYAFRFLKVSLHLELASHQDLTAALTQLRAVNHLATECGDKAVLAMATIMEAMIHLKDLGGTEGFEQAQTALATVRSLQTDQAISDILQLSVFTSFADISCHLQRVDPAQALSSMQNMTTVLALLDDGEKEGSDGSFAIPLTNAKMPSTRSENGVIRRKADGSFVLMFRWMPNKDIYNVGYLLSGIAMAHKNMTDGKKSEAMFSDGMQKQQIAQQSPGQALVSILLATTMRSWRERMDDYVRLYHAFSLAARTSWVSANSSSIILKKDRHVRPDAHDDLFLLTQYLKGTIAQGTGDVSAALSIYQALVDTICPASLKQWPPARPPIYTFIRGLPHLKQEVYLLSTLNILQIIRDPTHPDHHQSKSLLADIAPLCTQYCPNRNIVAAYHLISAACPAASSTIITTKQSLQSAIQAAKATSNNQLMCMVLNIMSWKFFSGVIGEQADKSARASLTLAKRGGDSLWSCVANGVLTETLEAAGRIEEAEEARLEGEKYARDLPVKIQEAMMR